MVWLRSGKFATPRLFVWGALVLTDRPPGCLFRSSHLARLQVLVPRNQRFGHLGNCVELLRGTTNFHKSLETKILIVFQLGAFFGAIFAFLCGDKLGRKKTIWVGVMTNFIGAVLQITSWHLPQMIVGRVINGFGMGRN